jgi:pimeloyl-ACP methyl ester carboxylesterase
MSPLAITSSGTGAPLVLLHGLGASRRSFDPVLPALAARFNVIAVDLPGFGESAPRPGPGEVAPAVLAQHVADLLDELGVSTPHVVGNSLGGWVALELASRRPVASLTLLSPAGLWPKNTPLYDRISLRASRWLARHTTGLLCRLVASRLGRALVLGQTHGHPMRLSTEYARAAVTELGRCPGFEAALAGTAKRHFVATVPIGTVPIGSAPLGTAPIGTAPAGSARIGTVPVGIGTMPITAPVTVAFGSRDVLLLRGSRQLGQLPPQTRTEALPGCGHLPMADDPAAVAALIIRTATQATLAATRADRTAAPADRTAVADAAVNAASA